MLVRQTLAYLAANVSSALFGFFNVFVFTHAFAPQAFGEYLLGLGFATIVSTLLGAGVKLAILRGQARGDGSDMRGVALAALLAATLSAPLAVGVALLCGLAVPVALAAIAMAFAILLFEAGQEVLRAEQRTQAFVRGTLARATLVSLLGFGCALFARGGAQLLFSSAIAYALAALVLWRRTWGVARPLFDAARLATMTREGLPLALSLGLLAVSGVADRFLIARLVGIDAAGQFGASLDLVRQSLIIPAISVAAAFVPIAVRLLANEGAAAARAHLAHCLELLLAIVLPACVGFALVAPEIADLVLGPQFRATAHEAMPILAIAVAAQIVTQQYVHNSFLLSNRNIFYFLATGSMLAFNLALALLLIPRFGAMGAVFGRLGGEAFGLASAWALSRFAFRLPFPAARVARVGAATAIMAGLVGALEPALRSLGPVALAPLIACGIVAYAAAAWLLDIADSRRGANEIVARLRRLAAPARARDVGVEVSA